MLSSKCCTLASCTVNIYIIVIDVHPAIYNINHYSASCSCGVVPFSFEKPKVQKHALLSFLQSIDIVRNCKSKETITIQQCNSQADGTIEHIQFNAVKLPSSERKAENYTKFHLGISCIYCTTVSLYCVVQ
jgi:hypothetical protein